MMETVDTPQATLSSQTDTIEAYIAAFEHISDQEVIEQRLYEVYETAPEHLAPDSDEYYAVLNFHLYRYALKHYKHRESNICFWRYIKQLSPDQLDNHLDDDPHLKMMDRLVRTYFYSDPLDDLTCIFIPVNNSGLIKQYLEWIQRYFYDVNYPTSLLWLYALDSSLSSLFPDEIIFLGKRTNNDEDDILIPDFAYDDAVLIKRFSDRPDHYVLLEGASANSEFQQIFTFLEREYKDRCLSRSVKQEDDVDLAVYRRGWENFEDVLRFGVSDKTENGCISFSDLRSSTEFLNKYGKHVYLNKIQQPFFENTKIISRRYNGRIDKFMGDNVMSVFLNNNMRQQTEAEREACAIVSNFCALFGLCKMLYRVVGEAGVTDSQLGLRSGVTYGRQILRSNLGNEIVRDFTVTGDSVNLAARLEHISIPELILHNQMYFEKAIERFPLISELISVSKNFENLNPETRHIIRDFTLYQNILSNLERLSDVKFDIRFNQEFYFKLRQQLFERGYRLLNPDTSEIYGYEEFEVEGYNLRFYYSYYNPKGFNKYETIWILPLPFEVLDGLDIDKICDC